MIKREGLAFILLFIFLFFLLKSISEYHFYMQEQNQLFLFSSQFVLDKISLPGGLAALISGWLVQFFLIPKVGALLVSLLLITVGFLTWKILRRIDEESNWVIMSILPALSLLCMQWNMNYMNDGTVAFIMMTFALYIVIGIKDRILRYLYAVLFSVALFWFAGPISMLFSISILLYETITRSPKFYLYLSLPILIWLLGLLSLRLSLVGESRLIFLPDGYYHYRLSPDNVIYYSWISFVLAIMVVASLKSKRALAGKWRLLFIAFQLFLLPITIWKGYEIYGDNRSYTLKMMAHFAGKGEWNRILELCHEPLRNQLFVCYQNMALANKGVLADQAFKYTQVGPSGLMVTWNKSTMVSALLSDVNFTIGNVASAQEMAFECDIATLGGGNPRMLKRLIQTNIIYGAYPIAEKYIAKLEKTIFYADWAARQRRFLYNDKEVEADPLLGYMRSNLLEENHLVQVDGFDNDMLRLVEQNPKNIVAMQYAGIYYLLAKDIEGFKKFVERYYGTDLLPELPQSYQEALILISERDEKYWRRFGVSDSIVSRFVEYKKQILAGRNNSSSLPGLLYRSFGDTYWYYYMYR